MNCLICDNILIDERCYLCEMKSCNICNINYFDNCECEENNELMKTNYDICSHCGGETLIDNSYYVCSKCGIINKDIVYSKSWNYKTTSSSQHEFDNNLTNTKIGSENNCIMEFTDANGNKYKKKLQTIQYQGQYNSERQKYENGIMDIKKISVLNNINESIISYVKEYWKKFMKLKKNNKGIIRRAIIANCFFYGFIESGFERTVLEICKMMDIDIKTYKKGEKIIRPILYDLSDSKLNLEDEEDMYQNRFIRLVNEMELPFYLSSEMNDLYNQKCIALRLQNTENIIGSIFIHILDKHFNINKNINIYDKVGIKKNSFYSIRKILQDN